MIFESTIAACHKYRAMPLQVRGSIAAIRQALISATGATRFNVRGHDKRVLIESTGELIGRITEESEA